jgi:hypothetical protein
MSSKIYHFLVFIIIGISCIDAALNVIYPVTAHVEKNPLAKVMLIGLNDNLRCFIGLKLIGTFSAFLLLRYIYKYPRVAWQVAIPLAIIQTGVMCYMVIHP